MKWKLGAALAVALSASAAAAAQSGQHMNKAMKDGGMTETYTGCIAPGTGDGFLLTHIAAGHEMAMHGKDMSKEHAMAHDAGGGTSMSPDGMSGDSMMPATVRLVGLSGLDKHVGQKVTIKGSVSHASSEGMTGQAPAFAAVSLKVVSKTCS